MLVPREEPPPAKDLPSLVDTTDDGDRPSITETNGTVARFEMAYNPNPGERFAFGPPWWQRIPSLVFLVFALVLVFLAVTRPVAAPWLAYLVLVTALGNVLATSLRGVIVTR